mgnify:CR=1 FL=1
MPKHLTALHVGSETLAILSLKQGKRGWRLIGAETASLEVSESEDLVPAIRSVARSLNPPDKRVILSLPKQQATVRCATLPSTDPAELTQMARFEAERHIPFHPERHATGFHVMRSGELEGSEVMLGAVDGPIIDRLLEGVDKAGLQPDGVTLSSACLINTLAEVAPREGEENILALVSIGLDSLDLVVLREGRMVFARSVAMDLSGILQQWLGLTDAEDEALALRRDIKRLGMTARMIDCLNLDAHYGEAGAAQDKLAAERFRAWLDRIIREVRLTYDFARREMKCPPIEALVLTGEGAVIKNLDQYLQKNLNLPVRRLNPIEKLERADQRKYPFEGFEFAIPYGAAVSRMGGNPYQLDLTPPSYYRRQSARLIRRQLVATAALTVLTAVLMIAAFMKLRDTRQRELRAYQEANRILQPRVAELQEMQEKLAIIEDYIKDPNSALLVLNSIAGAGMIPDRLSTQRVEFKKGDDLTIDGYAKSIEDINRFADHLRKTGHFLVVEPGNFKIQQIPHLPHDVYEFHIDCKIDAQRPEP